MSGGGGSGGGHPTRLGLVRCEHCQRQFNPHSAARHIPWCKKQQSDGKKHKLSADKLQALERYRWRIGYKPTNKFSQQQQQQNVTTNKSRHVSLSSINSSGGATLSSPSASSTSSSLSNSIASTSHVLAGARNNTHSSSSSSRQQQQHNVSANANSRKSNTKSNDENFKLKRSVSSVISVRHKGDRGDGSASSKNSRISTTTTTIRALEPGELLSTLHASGQASLAARARSVSDLSSMGELVETLAKRMEAIYAQNQLLLESIISSGKGSRTCDRVQKDQVRDGGANARADDAAGKDNDDDDDDEFAQCHHCRAKCLVEANYCHKCGCKMRPSNPTPPSD